MNKRLTRGTFLIAGLFVLLFSCSKKDSSSPATGIGEPEVFDKSAMLVNYADNLIMPQYHALQEELEILVDAVNAFDEAPSATTLDAVKSAYRYAHYQYMNVEVFNFGPAGTAQLEYFANFFGGFDYSFTQDGMLAGYSVDTTSIENNITTGNYDLTEYSRNSFYSQGFPALSYLLYVDGALTKFENSAGRIKYLKDVTDRLKALVDKVYNDWSAYRSTFIANTKSDVGSPIGNLVNRMAYQMDIMKGPRIGWPFGKQSNGNMFPAKSEAYFAGFGATLAYQNMMSLKNTFMGGIKEKGISDYLLSLNKGALNSDVIAQFDIVLGKLEVIPEPLSQSFMNDAVKVEDAYKEIQKLLTLLKTDVSSALGVQISFMDNDGD